MRAAALLFCLTLSGPHPAAAARSQAAASGTPAAARRISVPLAGTVLAWVPPVPASHVVLLVSSATGWNAAMSDLARHIAGMPAVVIGISYPTLRRNAAREGGCWYVASDFELISHAAQKTLALPQYYPPALVGVADGAAAVFAALAAAPAVTFAGGLSLAFCPTLRVPHEICSGDTWTPDYDDSTQVNTLPRAEAMPRDWFVLQGTADRVCPLDGIRKFTAGMPGTHLVEVTGGGHTMARAAVWLPAVDRALQDLWTERAPRPPAARPHSATTRELEDELQQLPLPLEFRWPAHVSALLLFYSGDGGWASLDEATAEQLVAHDVGVVGVSSLRYFWNRKSPADVAADMRRLVTTLTRSGKPVFAGGFSFGAEIVPVALREWSSAERRALSGLVLISPSVSASFEIDPLDWIRRPPVDPATRVAPAVRAVGLPTLVLCGAKDDDTPCPALADAAGVRVVQLPGSHHFDGDYTAVANAVLAFLRAPGVAEHP
ncbi:MAG: AcvB/VirJ family lysyl-phosphatidylglycerol hydrolase [Betaproteobacteria bacterium]